MDILVGLVWLVSCIGVTLAGEYCWTDDYEYEYCSNDCCSGSCCPALPEWAISLIVMALVFVIGLIVLAICCWHKKKGRMGRVMGFQGGRQTTVTTVNCVQAQPGYQPGYQPSYQPSHGFQQQSLGIQPLPPAYGQASAYPPVYGAQPNCNPAFPPRQY